MYRRKILYGYAAVLLVLAGNLWVGIFNIWDIVDHKPAIIICSVMTAFALLVASLVIRIARIDYKESQEN